MKQDNSNETSIDEAWEAESEFIEESFEDWILSNTEEDDDNRDNNNRDNNPKEKQWVPYEGPQGGQGWQREDDPDDVRYTNEPPGEIAEGYEEMAEGWGDDSPELSEYSIYGDSDNYRELESEIETILETGDFDGGAVDTDIQPLTDEDEFDETWDMDGENSYTMQPSGMGLVSTSVKMPVEDWYDLQEYIGEELNSWDEGSFYEEVVPERLEPLKEALRGEREFEYYDGVPIPYVIVGSDGSLKSTQEGRHRAVAAKEVGLDEIPAKILFDADETGEGGNKDTERNESDDEEGNEYSVEEAEQIASDVLGVSVDSSNFDSVEELVSVFESTVDDDRFDTTEDQIEELRNALDIPSKDEVDDFGRNERRPTVDLPTPNTDLNTEPFDTDDYGDVWDNTDDIDALQEAAFDRLSEEHDKEAVGLTELTLENWERKGYSYIEEIWSAAMAFNDVDTTPNHFVDFGKSIDPDEKVHNALYDMMKLSQSQAKEDFGDSVTVYRAFEKSTIEDYAQKNDDGSITIKPQVLESWSIEEDVTRKHARQRSDESEYVFAEKEVSTDEVGFYGPFAIGATTKAYKELTLSRTDEYTIDGENLENYDVEEFKMKQDVPMLPVEESDWIHSPNISPDMFKSWVPYVGPREGTGWQSTEDADNVIYDEEPPGEIDISAMDIESMGDYLVEIMGQYQTESFFNEASDRRVIEEAVEAAASDETELLDTPPDELEPGDKALFPEAGVVTVGQEVNDSMAMIGPNIGYLNLEGDYVATINGDRTTDDIPDDAEVLSLTDVWEVRDTVEYTPEAADIDSVDLSDAEDRRMSNSTRTEETSQRLTQDARKQLWGELGKIHLDASEEMRTLLQQAKMSSYSMDGRKRELAFLDAIGRDDLDVRNGNLTGKEPDADLIRMSNEIIDVSRRAFEEQFGEQKTVYRGISNTAFEELIEEAIDSEDDIIEFNTYGMTNFATEEGVGEKFAVTRKTANIKREATVDDVLSWTDYIIGAMNEAELSLIGGSNEISTEQIDIPWTGNTLQEELQDPSEEFLLGLQERGLRQQFEAR